MLLKEFKDVFAWTYKDLKNMLPKLVQHKIGLDTSIPPAHETRYRLNLNYVIVIEQDIEKLLIVKFIQLVEGATWLSSIMVVPKKNRKLKICVDFKKLNKVTKKVPYPLPFFDEILKIVV